MTHRNFDKVRRLVPTFLAVALLTACGDSGSDAKGYGGGDNAPGPPSPTTYSVGGTVASLATGTTLVLQDNSGDSTTLNANGAFTFPTHIASGGNYNVTVSQQPQGESCTVAGGTGTVSSAAITNVSVTCAPLTATFTVGGTVTGLAPGMSIGLQINGGGSITVPSSSSTFTFAVPIATGSQYNVTIATQPTIQNCTVASGGSGVVPAANVTNVAVDCPLLTQIWTFGNDPVGNQPAGGLSLGTGGVLYGTTTRGGGAYGMGTVYQITPSAAPAPTVFAIFTSATNLTAPLLVQTNSGTDTLYGASNEVSAFSRGTIFSVTSAGTPTILWNFGGTTSGVTPDGDCPNAIMLADDGNFYGTTSFGGPNGVGTVFELTSGGTKKVLYSFGVTSTDGQEPFAGLVEASDGTLYGTTSKGGTSGYGTIFRITTPGTSPKYSVVYNFSTTDGAYPEASLIRGQGSDNNLYGTAVAGGINGFGTVFKFTPPPTGTSIGTLTVLWSLSEGDGEPFGALIQGKDGNFYGVAQNGGSVFQCGPAADTGCGSIFQVTPSGQVRVLWDFSPTNGLAGVDGERQFFPLGLVQGTDGNFYGATMYGGTLDLGTVFKLTP